MSNKSRIIVVIISVVAIFVVIVGIPYKEQIYLVKAQTNSAKLTFQIETSNNRYLQGEPILFHFKLSNQTNSPIPWKGILFIGQNTSFLVRNSGGGDKRIDNFHFGSTLMNVIEMEPGKSVLTKSLLQEKDLERLFPEPGQYEVRIEFTYYKDNSGTNKETIVSNPISIIIDAPTGINKLAFDFLKGTIEPRELKMNLQELIDLQQRFVDSHRNSVYAKYMIVKLANNYKFRRDYAKAERELCKIRNEDFPFQADVERTLQELAAKLRPMPLIPNLPETATLPPRPQPCGGPPSP